MTDKIKGLSKIFVSPFYVFVDLVCLKSGFQSGVMCLESQFYYLFGNPIFQLFTVNYLINFLLLTYSNVQKLITIIQSSAVLLIYIQ